MLKPILALFLSLVALSPALAAKVSLSGEVTYRERIALPQPGTLQLDLIDQSIPDRPRLSVRAAIGEGQVPLGFAFSFEDSLILPQHAYGLVATILAGSAPLFRNAEPVPVTPLAQLEPIVIVTTLVAQLDPNPPPAAVDPAPLAILDTTWIATRIGDASVPADAGVTLLIGTDLRAGGVGGCNSWFSQAEVGKDTIAIGNVAATQRSCLYERNMREQAFFKALKSAVSWTVEGDRLLLRDAAGTVLLEFTR